MLKCEGLKGQCECEDKTICRWTGDDYYNENCPCGGSYGSKKRYGNRDDIWNLILRFLWNNCLYSKWKNEILPNLVFLVFKIKYNL